MKQVAYIAGVGMTPFGKHIDTSLKALGNSALDIALSDAGLEKKSIQAAWVGTAAAGVITGQVCVPGQAVLRETGIGTIPIVNVENACATAATAFQQACSMVTLGAYDVVLALGVEKLYCEEKAKTFSVFSGAIDVEKNAEVTSYIEKEFKRAGAPYEDGAGESRSLFVDIYAATALNHMREYGTTQEQLAAVSAKNSLHGSLNPLAQFRDRLTKDDVLSARTIAWPLTLPMCSPIGDGAAAAIIVSEKKARELGLSGMVKVEASMLLSGWDNEDGRPPHMAYHAARSIYEAVGVGPEDLSCVELHDASAISEITYYEYLGLCLPGDGGLYVTEGHSALGGRTPVNTSGGLMRKGHPIGATGLAQITELVDQIRGRAGARQVDGARLALAENGGGFIGRDAAAMVMTLLSKA